MKEPNLPEGGRGSLLTPFSHAILIFLALVGVWLVLFLATFPGFLERFK